MDYLNDYVPGLFSTLKAESLEEFKNKVTDSDFIKPRGPVSFDPSKPVFKGEEIVFKFKLDEEYDEPIKIVRDRDLTAIEAFYILLSNQYQINPRYCFFESIERIKKPVIDEGELKYIPLFEVKFRR